MHPIEQKLAALGIELPSAPPPAANYVPSLIAGKLLMISGQLPMEAGALAVKGRVGADLSIDEGRRAARLCAINILAQAKQAAGSFDAIERLVKLGGFVNAPAEFPDHPMVINGASDFMVEVMGEAGRHTRFAVGACGLPFGAAVEIEAVFALK